MRRFPNGTQEGFGAIAGLASVMLVMLLGQSRVLYTISRDDLLWKWVGGFTGAFARHT